MNLIFKSFADILMTENHIKQLHRILLQFSKKDIRHRGEYKKFPNHVEAFDQNGKSLGMVFETATPFETPTKMEALTNWTRYNLKSGELHPLLVIAIFTVHFLAIHPFQDGNGRLSRILTTLLLLQNGYGYVPYSSLESIIEQNKEAYYLALKKAQQTIKTDDSGLETWIMLFLDCMKKQKDNLARKVEHEHLMQKLPDLSNKIIEVIKVHGRISISGIHAITKANRNTIKIRLRELVKNGYLIKEGEGKGTRYILGNRSAG